MTKRSFGKMVDSHDSTSPAFDEINEEHDPGRNRQQAQPSLIDFVRDPSGCVAPDARCLAGHCFPIISGGFANPIRDVAEGILDEIAYFAGIIDELGPTGARDRRPNRPSKSPTRFSMGNFIGRSRSLGGARAHSASIYCGLVAEFFSKKKFRARKVSYG